MDKIYKCWKHQWNKNISGGDSDKTSVQWQVYRNQKMLIYVFLISCFGLLWNWRHQNDNWNIREGLFRPLQTKMKFSFRYLFSKYDKVHIFFCIWINLLKKYWIENFIFCVVGFFVTNVLYNHLVSEVHLQVPKTVKSCRKAILSRRSISS